MSNEDLEVTFFLGDLNNSSKCTVLASPTPKKIRTNKKRALKKFYKRIKKNMIALGGVDA